VTGGKLASVGSVSVNGAVSTVSVVVTGDITVTAIDH
jgi:ABC-type glucose/galactose transport system permease subunit